MSAQRTSDARRGGARRAVRTPQPTGPAWQSLHPEDGADRADEPAEESAGPAGRGGFPFAPVHASGPTPDVAFPAPGSATPEAPAFGSLSGTSAERPASGRARRETADGAPLAASATSVGERRRSRRAAPAPGPESATASDALTSDARASDASASPAASDAPERPARHSGATPSPAVSDTPERPARRRTGRGRLGVPAVLDRPLVLVATTAVALIAGLGVGAVTGLIGSGQPAAASPAQCASAQVAWTESASNQVQMSADDPATLRSGFLGARTALSEATPPPVIAADWKVVKDYVDTVAKAVEPLRTSDGAAISDAVGVALSHLDTAAATAASTRVTAYLKADCAR